jgi:hypothetical protein
VGVPGIRGGHGDDGRKPAEGRVLDNHHVREIDLGQQRLHLDDLVTSGVWFRARWAGRSAAWKQPSWSLGGLDTSRDARGVRQ